LFESGTHGLFLTEALCKLLAIAASGNSRQAALPGCLPADQCCCVFAAAQFKSETNPLRSTVVPRAAATRWFPQNGSSPRRF
jgi:hypothetical protein